MTKLNSTIARETQKRVQGRPIVVTLIPGTDSREPMLALRLKGTRVEYRGLVSDLYRVLALWHSNAERSAKAQARKDGIPWREARKAFLRRLR